MKFKRSLRVVTSILVGAALLVVGWYALSPRWAISKLSDWETVPEHLSELYDRQLVREAFERQMLPQVAYYPPPITKEVVLVSLSDPRAIRMFVKEPYGEWQFAASAGLPPRLALSDPTRGNRIIETTKSWNLHWSGFSSPNVPASKGMHITSSAMGYTGAWMRLNLRRKLGDTTLQIDVCNWGGFLTSEAPGPPAITRMPYLPDS